MNKETKNQRVKFLMDTAAHQVKPHKFEKYMESVRELSEDAIQWFNKTNRNGDPILTKE